MLRTITIYDTEIRGTNFEENVISYVSMIKDIYRNGSILDYRRSYYRIKGITGVSVSSQKKYNRYLIGVGLAWVEGLNIRYASGSSFKEFYGFRRASRKVVFIDEGRKLLDCYKYAQQGENILKNRDKQRYALYMKAATLTLGIDPHRKAGKLTDKLLVDFHSGVDTPDVRRMQGIVDGMRVLTTRKGISKLTGRKSHSTGARKMKIYKELGIVLSDFPSYRFISNYCIGIIKYMREELIPYRIYNNRVYEILPNRIIFRQEVLL